MLHRAMIPMPISWAEGWSEAQSRRYDGEMVELTASAALGLGPVDKTF